MRLICRVLWIIVYPVLKLLEPCIQRWVKPTNQFLALGTVADLTRGVRSWCWRMYFYRNK